MRLPTLVLRELSYRKLNFVLALLAVAAAVAGLVGLLVILTDHDTRTARSIAAQETQVTQRAKELEDDYRKITKGLGFNVLILPKDQNMADFLAEGYASKTMPESYVTKLAEAKDIATIEHLLPALEQRTTWTEHQDRAVRMVGVRGQVPFVYKQSEKKPLLDPVNKGEIVLGYELHHQYGLKVGQQITFRGQAFKISKAYPQRGTQDDITVWISLAEAQKMLDKPGQINAIWALNCNCFSADRLAEMRAEITRYLPDTQVTELSSNAMARAEARKRAHTEAQQQLEFAKKDGLRQRADPESLGSLLLLLVVLGGGVWIGLLALGNVRERLGEIGILRAMGVRAYQILGVFLLRALLVGVLGAVVGVGLGLLVAYGVARRPDAAQFNELVNARIIVLMALTIPAAALLAMLASWIPAVLATKQDPALVLCRE